MANVTIDIATQFKGKPAFDKAGKSVSGLEKSVNKLAKTFAGVFVAQNVIAFGKATVKAFEEDQKSAALLANTMKNLGLQFANPEIEAFISKLSQAAGVADDQLRPAMQTLLTTTGSVVNSQKMLAQAIDISRGSGIELATVVQDLNNAFVGNTKGLKKYNLGLTQAELKAASFADIQAKLNAQFSGSSSAYLQTYAGKMDVLNTAAGEAKETIGKGLVDALTILAGKEGDIQGVADAFGNIATQISDVTTGLAMMIGELKKLPGAGIVSTALSAAAKATGLSLLFGAAKKKANQAKSSALAPASANSFLTEHQASLNAAKAAKAEKDAKARAAAILKSQQANTKALKEQALLKKQSSLFDLQQIELIAALKGKLSDEDRKRAELQLALLQEDESTAKLLTSQIADAIDKTGNLKTYLNSITATNDPFKNWMDSLEKIAAKAATIGMSGTDAASTAGTVATNTGTTNTGSTYGAAYAPLLDYAKGVSVTINNAGSVISEKELLAQIINGTQLASMSASPTTLSRIAGMFGN